MVSRLLYRFRSLSRLRLHTRPVLLSLRADSPPLLPAMRGPTDATRVDQTALRFRLGRSVAQPGVENDVAALDAQVTDLFIAQQ